MMFHKLLTAVARSPCLVSRSLSAAASPPAGVWSLGKLNHVAIAVPDLAAATSLYRDMLGATVSPPQVSNSNITKHYLSKLNPNPIPFSISGFA